MQMTDIVAPESVRKDILVLARSKIMRGRLSEGVDVTAETMCFLGEYVVEVWEYQGMGTDIPQYLMMSSEPLGCFRNLVTGKHWDVPWHVWM